MTRYTCQKHRVAYNAFCNGYRIEMRNPETGTWSETTEPCWLPDWEYRVVQVEDCSAENERLRDIIRRARARYGVDNAYGDTTAAEIPACRYSSR
jgi:hypothetical protein